MKDNEIIDEFGGNFVEILSKFSVLGISIEEFKFDKKFLLSFFRKKYIYIVAFFE